MWKQRAGFMAGLGVLLQYGGSKDPLPGSVLESSRDDIWAVAVWMGAEPSSWVREVVLRLDRKRGLVNQSWEIPVNPLLYQKPQNEMLRAWTFFLRRMDQNEQLKWVYVAGRKEALEFAVLRYKSCFDKINIPLPSAILSAAIILPPGGPILHRHVFKNESYSSSLWSFIMMVL